MATRSRESLAREAFGKDLKKLRLSQGLTIATVARAATISAGTWSRYEHGISRPGIDKAPLLAKALGLPIAALFPSTDPTSLVIAELRLSHDTVKELRKQGDSYRESLTHQLTNSLDSTLKALATKPRKTPHVPFTPRDRSLRSQPEFKRVALNRQRDAILASH